MQPSDGETTTSQGTTMHTAMKKAVGCSVALVMAAALSIAAHEMTLKGTVAAVEARRIQIKTGEEKQGESPDWFAVDAKTKILRGQTRVTFQAAKIQVGERIVATVDHDVARAIEIRLAAAATK
jgi:hypothetical protein